MTVKQVIIWGSIYLWINVVDVAVLSDFHIQKSIPLMATIFWTLFSGILLGGLQQKWKRDKEFAKIVADRLMRKPDVQTQSGNQTNMNPNTGWSQQAMSQQANALSSMLRGTGISGGQGTLNNILGRVPGDGSGLGKR